MRSAFVFLIAVALLAIFSALNWQALSETTELNLLVANVMAPVGIILLGVIGVLLLAMALVLAWAHTAHLLQHRAHARESDRLRALSEAAESSRLTQMRSWMEAEMALQAERVERTAERLVERMNAMELALLRRQEEGENSLSAHLGELEDRLDGGSQTSTPGRYS